MALSWLIDSPALIKILIFFLMWVGLWLPIAIVSAMALNWHPPQPLQPQQKLVLLASLYLVVPLLVGGITYLEQVPMKEYGLMGTRQIGVSIAIGCSSAGLSLMLLSAVQWLLGSIDWKNQPNQIPPWTVLSLGGLAVWISATEEVVFRGFLQTQLQQDYSLWVAAAIASSIFALSHLLWNLRDTVPQLLGLWVMGMVLTLARINDQGLLGLGIGLHAGWIWGIGLIEQMFIPAQNPRLPSWIMGSLNRPLGSVLAVLMLLMVGMVLALSR